MRRLPVASLLWATVLLPVPGAASAQGLLQGISGVLDFSVGHETITITNTDTGTVTTDVFDNMFPRLTLNVETQLYPNLRLSTGGVFEVNATRAGDGAPDSTLTRLRPFVELRSTGAVLSPGVGYYRREERTKVGDQPRLDLVSDDYAAYLGWKPAGLAQTDFQFVRTNTRDADRRFLDTTRDFGSILSRYTYESLNVYYQGSALDTTDHVQSVNSRVVSNSGRVDFSRAFQNRRGLWNTTYNLGHFSVTTEATGEGGEVALPVLASSGLSILSDTPVTARLNANPLLVDGNLTAGAGVNLGLPPIGADARARNIGLDFLNATGVNRFLVWIDRDLPAEIASTFSWEVYTSPDNLLWTRATVAVTSIFGPFENRFRLDFGTVTARHVKVVTRPLSGAVQDAAKYPDILVAELQAFLVQPAGVARGRVSQTSQNLSTDLRYRLLERPSLYYEGSYWFNDAGSSGTDRHLLSNGLAVDHRFNRMWGAYGRGALEVGREPEGRRVAGITNATLNYDPIDAFTASLLYSGRNERLDDRPNDQRSVTLQTNSRVYRGVDVQFGVGWNFLTRETGEELRDRFLTVTAAVVPRPNLTFTISYTDSHTTRSGAFEGEPVYDSRRMLATLSYDPIRTLHIAVAEEVVSSDIEGTRTFTNLGVNWSPFPDGTLQFFVTYNEAFRPLEYGTERDFRPGLRWRFSRQSYIDVAYEWLRTEFLFQTTASEIVSANLRVFF